ncbi:MAG: iron-siderophore ABC transporter substrate-binding protein [Egibacteraceae bacterium]
MARLRVWLVLLCLAAVACGTGASPPAAGQGAGQGAFPVTIEHKYGSTEVPEEPERVITVGRIEQDAVLALGVVPVAATEWFGEYPGAIFPWAQDALGDASAPEVLQPSYSAGGLPFERIAALRPDLILALYSDITARDYDTLSRIAPTIAQPGEYPDLGISWQELTRTVGVALGRTDQAKRLVAGVEARFAQARQDHPEFAGSTALNVYSAGDGTYQAYPPPDLGGRLLTDLGLSVPTEIAELAGGQPFVEISGEQLDLFDTDVLVWLVDNDAQREQIRANPVYARLDVATEGRDVFLNYETDTLSAATSFQTVLSLPFLLDGLVPLLAAAIDGDPTTTTGL